VKFFNCPIAEISTLLAKGYLLIKDNKELNALAYSEFIAALVSLKKRR
jgi:hypothetical protein